MAITRDGIPVAELRHVAAKGTRRGGQWRGNALISDDFDAPTPDDETLFGFQST